MIFARAERRTLDIAGGLALGGVLVFVGAATVVLLAHAGGGDAPEVSVKVDDEYVRRQLSDEIQAKDVKKYIL